MNQWGYVILKLSPEKNVALLSVGQCLYMTSSMVMFTFAGLVGQLLSADQSLATLPISLVMAGTAAMTVPASLFMRRYGRRTGFIAGATAGVLSGIMGAVAIYYQDFRIFCLTGLLQGIYQAFAQYYRFAAIEVSAPALQPRAISFVLAGGIGAALIAPTLAHWSNDYFAPVTFIGAYILVAILGVIALIPLSFLHVPKPQEMITDDSAARPLSVIMRQPVFICAVVNGAAGYALMSLVMTAAPLAVVACGFAPGDAAHVIQWHVLAMFVPALFSGRIIQHFGPLPVLFAGVFLYACSAIVALSGQTMPYFTISMMLLGLAWNFMFTAATTLLAKAYLPSERAKVQGVNEFLLFLTTALASLAAGAIQYKFGWMTLNTAVFAIMAIALTTSGWFALSQRKTAQAVL